MLKIPTGHQTPTSGAKVIKGRQIKSVAQAEQKIQKLLGTNEANWKDVAKIAIEVKEQELYKDKYKSFTA